MWDATSRLLPPIKIPQWSGEVCVLSFVGNLFFFCTFAGPTATHRSCPRRSCVMRDWQQLNLNLRRSCQNSPLHRWDVFPFYTVRIKEKVWKSDRFKVDICNAQWLFLYQENSPGAATKDEALGTVKTVASTMTNHSESQVNEAAEILTNEITVGKGKDMKGLRSHSLPHKKPSGKYSFH